MESSKTVNANSLANWGSKVGCTPRGGQLTKRQNRSVCGSSAKRLSEACVCRHPHALLCSSSWYFTLDYFQDSLLAPLTPASLHPTCYRLPASGIAFIKQRSDYVTTLPKTLRFHVCRTVSTQSSSQPDQLCRLVHTKAIPCTHTHHLHPTTAARWQFPWHAHTLSHHWP